MSTIYKEFGNTVRRRRKAKSLTTQDISHRLNISAGLINNIENGRNDVFKLELLNEIIELLEIPISEIIDTSKVKLENLNITQAENALQIRLNYKANIDAKVLENSLKDIVNSMLDLVISFEGKEQAIEVITLTLLNYLEYLRKIKQIQ